MLTTEQSEKIRYQLDRIRHADKNVCPFMTTSQEFWYTNGYLSGLFNFGVIDPAEYVRLIDLAGNAFEYRSNEVIGESAPKPPVQEPVAWVEVIDRHEGPYNFHGLKLLDSGKHHLYTAPQPSDDVAKDAARYRWARENWWTEHLDATIDAAIAGTTK